MRAFAVVVVAVATLLGLGWYFANSNMGSGSGKASPAVITQTLAPANSNANSDSNSDSKFNLNAHANMNLNVNRPSDQLDLRKQNEKIQFDSGAHARNNHPSKNSDADFQMPPDENEVVGKYVHRQMVHPKDPSAHKHVPMDDDLLVMENRSEDRLSATR